MSDPDHSDPKSTAALLTVMARLRDPDKGCPWDVQQSYATIAPYTIEEAYEVADAIERGDMADLKEELGDLLLQVVFHARMAEEDGAFAFGDVVEAIVDKMVRRHPHVFGEAQFDNSEAQTSAWETMKAAERAEKGKDSSVLDDVPAALPALMRTQKLGKRASRAGFDWPDLDGPIAKIREELDELDAAIQSADVNAAKEELGDFLFSVVNLARKMKVDSETALRGANAKFERRFRHVELRIAQSGRALSEADLDEMESYWAEAKASEGD